MANIYKCSICGKEFDKAIDRAHCEINCTKHLEEETKKAAEAKKKAEQETRRAEVTKAIDNACALMEAYIRDYQTYTYNGKSDLFKDTYSPTKFLHHLLF